QLVKPGGPSAGLVAGGGAGLQLTFGPGRPWAPCGDSGLVLTFEGGAGCGAVGFELLPPSGHGRRLTVRPGLALPGWLTGQTAAFQFGPGLRAGFSDAGGGGGPFLVTGAGGFKPLA